MSTAAASRLLARARQGQHALIQLNPSRVTIERTSVAEVDGGPQEVTETLGPYTVRIFLEGPSEGSDVTDPTTGGTLVRQMGYSMAAAWDADLEHESRVRDEFTLGAYGRFRIVAVYPLRLVGDVFGYQAALELVS